MQGHLGEGVKQSYDLAHALLTITVHFAMGQWFCIHPGEGALFSDCPWAHSSVRKIQDGREEENIDMSFESWEVRYGQPLILQGGVISPRCLQILCMRICLLKNLLVTPETVLAAPLWSFAHMHRAMKNLSCLISSGD